MAAMIARERKMPPRETSTTADDVSPRLLLAGGGDANDDIVYSATNTRNAVSCAPRVIFARETTRARRVNVTRARARVLSFSVSLVLCHVTGRGI